MKRCPQCHSVFEDALVYCTNDGTPLVPENFTLPSEAAGIGEEEEITVIHHDPITIDVADRPAPTERFEYRPTAAPPAEAAIPIIVERAPRNTGKYLLFLVIGLLLGGGLVLATLLFARLLNEDKTRPAAVNANRPPVPESTLEARETPAETPRAASAKHERRTEAGDDEFNGRVISLNAYVRFLPSRGSAEVDVLPVSDRLDIDERENEDSPWYRVTCEHGTSGWMHGNTIEYTR